ncbi:hypothetical protein N7540_011170 [Penicillium herquei]|nr:hypothetical protein N7540_011170 [Penicillium herquei]
MRALSEASQLFAEVSIENRETSVIGGTFRTKKVVFSGEDLLVDFHNLDKAQWCTSIRKVKARIPPSTLISITSTPCLDIVVDMSVPSNKTRGLEVPALRGSTVLESPVVGF